MTSLLWLPQSARSCALFLIACTLLATVAPAPAHAGDDTTRAAREHFNRGRKLYDLQRFPEAAAEYEKAYELRDDPSLLFNIGQAYRGAGEAQKALGFYRAFLRRVPDAPNAAITRTLIEDLRKTLDEQRKAQEQQQQQQQQQQQAEEKPQPTPTPTPTPLPTPPPGPPPVDQQQLAQGKKLRLIGIGVGAFGVAALAVGGAMAGLTASVNDDLNHPKQTTPPPLYSHSLESTGRTYQTLSYTFFAVGGAALVGGVATILVGQQKIKRSSHYAFAPMIAPGTAGLTFSVER
jgi:tetratricopeptide (TPR) repeat protein